MLQETLALVATALITGSYIPQIVKAYRTKSMGDISLLYLSIIALGVVTWLAYALVMRDTVFAIANAVILSFALTLIALKIHYDRKRG